MVCVQGKRRKRDGHFSRYNFLKKIELTLLLVLFMITYAKQAMVLPHQVWIIILKSGFVIYWFVRTMANYIAGFNVIEEFINVEAPMMWKHIASDYFGTKGKQRNSFVIVSGNYGTKRAYQLWGALASQNKLSEEWEETSAFFCRIWNAPAAW